MRKVELLSEKSLRQELEEQGFDTSRLDDKAFQATPSSPDHPLPVSSSGDVYATLRVVGCLQKEIEEEETAMREEIARVKKIRTRRIEAKKRSLDWLTVPLKKLRRSLRQLQRPRRLCWQADRLENDLEGQWLRAWGICHKPWPPRAALR